MIFSIPLILRRPAPPGLEGIARNACFEALLCKAPQHEVGEKP
jgi:hypothetical protein